MVSKYLNVLNHSYVNVYQKVPPNCPSYAENDDGIDRSLASKNHGIMQSNGQLHVGRGSEMASSGRHLNPGEYAKIRAKKHPEPENFTRFVLPLFEAHGEIHSSIRFCSSFTSFRKLRCTVSSNI